MGENTEMPEGSGPGRSGRTRLIHVGPHKTGTTTVQSAFHRNRQPLAELGVHYVGSRLQPTQAAKAVAGITPPGPQRDAGVKEWEELLTEVRLARSPHVVLSSEFFCEADDQAARRIIEDFGAEGLRVVVTLRGLAKVIPSQWQQFVQTGSVQSLPDWVSWVLEESHPDSSIAFWRRHRHDRLVARWARLVGPDNVSVIVSDSRDAGQLPREFAALLGISPDVLVPASSTRNRSLTWEEAERIREFNIAFRKQNQQRAAEGLPPVELTSMQRLRAWGRVKRHPANPQHHRIELPEFAVDQVEEISREMVRQILASGVQVIGPVEQLVERAKTSGWNPGDTVAAHRATSRRVTRVAEELMRAFQVSDA